MYEKEYWATKPTEEIGSYLQSKIDNYSEYIDITGMMSLWKKSYRTFYNGFYNAGRVQDYGEQGEYKKFSVNHYKNLLQHLKVLTTQRRPSFDAKAANTDYKSMAQTVLANGLLDYYMRQKRLEVFTNQAVLKGLLYGEGYIHSYWDPSIGKEFSVDDMPDDNLKESAMEVVREDTMDEDGEDIKQQIVREGDIVTETLSPINVIRNPRHKNTEDNEWYIIRRFKNRYELAAKYPEFADEIKTTDNKYENEDDVRLEKISAELFDEDIIPVYTMYHKSTAAVPDGRQIEFINSDTIMFDGILQYPDIPLIKIIPDWLDNTIFGYTIGFDLLPIQESLDMITSSIITNQNAFGVSSITASKGSGVEVSTLSGGMKLIEFNGDKKPEPLDLLRTAPELFNFFQTLTHMAETISGVNSVARGNPESNLKSGAALALVQSMAIQFSSDLQNSYTQMLEDLGTLLINMLKKFAKTPRIAMIAGKNKKGYMKEFSADDLNQIERVLVERGNALSRTLAGRVNLAENLLKNGFVKTGEQYMEVLQTGKLEAMIEGETSEILLVRSENQKILDGENPPVTVLDNHVLHINEHKTIISSPEARENPGLVQIVLNHIQQHIAALQTADPVLMTLTGQPAMNQRTMKEFGAGDQMQRPSDNPQDQANQPNMPKPPKNALTSEPWNPQTGGL